MPQRSRRLARGARPLLSATTAAVPGMVPGAPKRNVLVAVCYAVGLLVVAGLVAG